MQCSAVLPDFNPLLVAAEHAIFRFDAVGLVELGHVRQHTFDAIHTWRMRICDQLLTQRFITEFGTPDLRPTDKETLVPGKTINFGGGFAL